MLAREYQSEQDWLKDIFRKSNSLGSRNRAETSLRVFDMWCKYKLEIPDPDISDLEEEKAEKLKFCSGHCFTNIERSTINAKYTQAVNDRYSPVYAKARDTG